MESTENKKIILIVEDDVFIRDIYQVKFSQEGFEVLSAEDGIKALDILKEKVPDIILLDILMPYMNGLEVLKKIKSNEALKNIPVIMLSNISEKWENLDTTKVVNPIMSYSGWIKYADCKSLERFYITPHIKKIVKIKNNK